MDDGADAGQSLAAALGRIPSGLFVVTAGHGQQETAFLASWVQQCSFDPPQITIAVNRQRGILDELTEGAAFVVNVIAESSRHLVGRFGKGGAPGQPAFEGLELRRIDGSPPVLLAAHAYLVCRVASRYDVSDHVLVVGRVTSGAMLQPGHPAVHVRTNGRKY